MSPEQSAIFLNFVALGKSFISNSKLVTAFEMDAKRLTAANFELLYTTVSPEEDTGYPLLPPNG